MAKFKFPRNPGSGAQNPFEDERGNNPFADQGAAAEPVDENPYGARGVNEPRPFQPGDYVTMLPHRSARVLALGVTGLLLAVVGVALAAAGVANSGNWTWGIGYGIPVQFLGLAVSLPAWIFGASDLKAMRAGAMQAEGRPRTRIGFVLGIVGVSIGMVPVLAWCAMLVAAAWRG